MDGRLPRRRAGTLAAALGRFAAPRRARPAAQRKRCEPRQRKRDERAVHECREPLESCRGQPRVEAAHEAQDVGEQAAQAQAGHDEASDTRRGRQRVAPGNEIVCTPHDGPPPTQPCPHSRNWRQLCHSGQRGQDAPASTMQTRDIVAPAPDRRTANERSRTVNVGSIWLVLPYNKTGYVIKHPGRYGRTACHHQTR